jgi:hypothetical protein
MQDRTGPIIRWLTRRWEDLSGAKREAIKQQGEAARRHLETKRELLKGRPDAEVPKEYLDEEFLQTSKEIRETLKP